MNKFAGLCAGLCLTAGCGAMVAQDMPPGPPKVLVIQREWIKPGKSGSIHQKTESAFVNAMVAAKWPTHYFAASSMSGKPRVLFFVGYPSFEAWEKDNHAMDKNATLSAAFDKASIADAEAVSEFQQDVLLYDPELSLHTREIAKDRYFEISRWVVKPGHRAEFLELVKMYVDGYGKASQHANCDDKKFADAMGPAKMKKIQELTAASVESTMTNLYEFKPSMSYPDDSWIKEDSFWKPKAPAAAKKPAAAPTN
jgi:hypothetical protein